MKVLTALACISVSKLQGEQQFIYKNLMAISSMLCNQLAWDCACM